MIIDRIKKSRTTYDYMAMKSTDSSYSVVAQVPFPWYAVVRAVVQDTEPLFSLRSRARALANLRYIQPCKSEVDTVGIVGLATRFALTEAVLKAASDVIAPPHPHPPGRREHVATPALEMCTDDEVCRYMTLLDVRVLGENGGAPSDEVEGLHVARRRAIALFAERARSDWGYHGTLLRAQIAFNNRGGNNAQRVEVACRSEGLKMSTHFPGARAIFVGSEDVKDAAMNQFGSRKKQIAFLSMKETAKRLRKEKRDFTGLLETRLTKIARGILNDALRKAATRGGVVAAFSGGNASFNERHDKEHESDFREHVERRLHEDGSFWEELFALAIDRDRCEKDVRRSARLALKNATKSPVLPIREISGSCVMRSYASSFQRKFTCTSGTEEASFVDSACRPFRTWAEDITRRSERVQDLSLPSLRIIQNDSLKSLPSTAFAYVALGHDALWQELLRASEKWRKCEHVVELLRRELAAIINVTWGRRANPGEQASARSAAERFVESAATWCMLSLCDDHDDGRVEHLADVATRMSASIRACLMTPLMKPYLELTADHPLRIDVAHLLQVSLETAEKMVFEGDERHDNAPTSIGRALAESCIDTRWKWLMNAVTRSPINRNFFLDENVSEQERKDAVARSLDDATLLYGGINEREASSSFASKPFLHLLRELARVKDSGMWLRADAARVRGDMVEMWRAARIINDD